MGRGSLHRTDVMPYLHYTVLTIHYFYNIQAYDTVQYRTIPYSSEMWLNIFPTNTGIIIVSYSFFIVIIIIIIITITQRMFPPHNARTHPNTQTAEKHHPWISKIPTEQNRTKIQYTVQTERNHDRFLESRGGRCYYYYTYSTRIQLKYSQIKSKQPKDSQPIILSSRYNNIKNLQILATCILK